MPIDISPIIFVGLLLGAYLIWRVGKKKREIRILRIAYVMSGVFLGMMAWFFIAIPLSFVLNLSGGVLVGVIVFLLCPVLMAIGAVIMDTVGKRRDYQPFYEWYGTT